MAEYDNINIFLDYQFSYSQCHLFYWITILIGVALIFDFLNGFHDSANVVATIISSRTLSGKKALAMAAIANFAGPFLFGVAVAKTIGHDIAVSE